jgi:hypothetical protein
VVETSLTAEGLGVVAEVIPCEVPSSKLPSWFAFCPAGPTRRDFDNVSAAPRLRRATDRFQIRSRSCKASEHPNLRGFAAHLRQL